MARPRISPQTLLVLSHLLDSMPEETHGFKIMKATGILSGTLYPILIRLEGEHWIESRWDDSENDLGPRRRLYSLTGDGEANARYELARHSSGSHLSKPLNPGWAT